MANIYRRGDELFLYVQFKNEKNQPITVTNPKVRILGEVTNILPSQGLLQMSSNEYYQNFVIPYDAPYSVYDIEYSADYNSGGLVPKVAKIVESFYVIPTSEVYSDAIKIYGFIHQTRTGYPLVGVCIDVSPTDNSKIISKSYTGLDGQWEAYLYPGEYNFSFNKFGFKVENATVQFGADYHEIQFDNVTLEPINIGSKGEGVFKISDKYTTKEGTPLNGLSVKASNAFNVSVVTASDVTNDAGEWELFLDQGTYLLKIDGTSLLQQFNQTFRLKVGENGDFTFENLTSNVAVPTSSIITVLDSPRGSGSKVVTDQVTNGEGNPIVDAQINVYKKNDLNTIIAQDYTDPGGRWEVYLDPGTYVFEFYHPEFHEFQEERIIG